MKKVFFSLFMIAALAGHAQSKKPVQDSSSHKVSDSLTNDTPLMTYKDYQDFLREVVMDMPAKYADQIRLWWATRIGQLVEQRQKKK